VTIALVPLLLAMFQQVSLVSPLANAIAIPLVSLVVVPLSLVAAALPLEWLALAAHGAMSVCMWPLHGLDDLPAVVWQQHAPPPWTVALAVAGAAWILLPRGFPARWAGAALLLPMFLVFPPAPREGELWLTVLDVGQGLAAVARTREHALLFDAGPAYSEQIDAGERIVVPFLRATGVRRLDGLMVSHDDLDHSGGAASVLRALPVDWLSSSLPLSHPLNATQELPQRCNAGQAWSWNGVAFAVIHPHIESYNDAQRKDNDRSCVLKIASPYGSVLLPADVERAGEASLVEHRRADLPAQVLVVPHHGSRTSSAPAFLAAVDPRLAIIPVGYRNRFGHPHPVVTARYRSRGTAILRTDLAGAVTVRMTAQGWEITRERELDRRYWRNM
jgi:competence protein ComEC